MSKKHISQKELKELFIYEPVSGLFIRNKQLPGSNYQVGSIAGSLVHEYVRIRVKDKHYSGHRLAWLYMMGVLPEEIDHINHNKSDNRWVNLREVAHQENMKNKKKYKNNSSGVVGVSWAKHAHKWRAIITVEKKQISLGLFVEFHEAMNARKNAEVLYGFHKNHGVSYE